MFYYWTLHCTIVFFSFILCSFFFFFFFWLLLLLLCFVFSFLFQSCVSCVKGDFGIVKLTVTWQTNIPYSFFEALTQTRPKENKRWSTNCPPGRWYRYITYHHVAFWTIYYCCLHTPCRLLDYYQCYHISKPVPLNLGFIWLIKMFFFFFFLTVSFLLYSSYTVTLCLPCFSAWLKFGCYHFYSPGLKMKTAHHTYFPFTGSTIA